MVLSLRNGNLVHGLRVTGGMADSAVTDTAV